MVTKFSDRIGVTKTSDIFQMDEMSPQLRNSLWNFLIKTVLYSDDRRFPYVDLKGNVKIIYERFFKYPTDSLPHYAWDCRNKVREVFMSPDFQWYKVYNFIEFIVNNCRLFGSFQQDDMIEELNSILEEEMSGYRFIEATLTPISDSTEIQSIDDALCSSGFNGVREHFRTAIQLLSKRPDPDYRNSIKESISAVESLTKTITGEKKGGLDKALTKLDHKYKFHGGFKSGLLSLYGFTSDDDGIRHAILDEPNVGFDEAKFMLIACSALVNFLISKTMVTV